MEDEVTSCMGRMAVAKSTSLMSTDVGVGSTMRGVTLSPDVQGEDSLEYTKEVRPIAV